MEKVEDQGKKTPSGVSSVEPETKDPDAKTLKEASKTSGLPSFEGSVESSRENGARVSINGNDSGVGDRKIDVSGDEEVGVEDSGVKMQESVKEVEGEGVTEKGVASDGDGVSLVVDIHGENVEIGVEENGDDLNESGGDPDGKKGEGSENEDGDGGEDEDDDDEHDLRVGDFVWGKIKSHPWWPGRIYDPSVASDYAVKVKQKDKILVAYFGDGTFAWCNSSQLMPFEENFEEMIKQSNSKNFVNAVQKAVDEIGRIVELKMTCSCVPKENLVGLDRPLAVNAGIKEGVYVPEGGTAELLATLFEPDEFLAEMKKFAVSASVTNGLEFVVLRSRLSAFYRAKRGHQLVTFYEPQPIPGLEDSIGNWVVDSGDSTNVVDVPIQGPFDDDWHSSPRGPKFGQTNQTLLQKCPGPGDRLYQRRKQKSIAEIMGGDTDAEAENEGDMAKEVTNSGKPASVGRKKRKGSDEVDAGGVNGSKSARRRRKETKLSGSPMTTDSKVSSVENDGSGAKEETKKKAVLSSTRKKNKGPSAANDGGGVREEANNVPVSIARKMKGDLRVKSDDGEAKEQTVKASLSRERKRSKYLSPPYTNISVRQSKKEIDEESVKVSNEAGLAGPMTRAAGHLLGSPPISKGSAETTQKKHSKELGAGHDTSDNSSPQTPKQDPNQVIDTMKVKAPPKEVLSGIRAAALSPQFLKENYSLDAVGGFLSTFRSSVYHDGSNYQKYSQRQPGRKRKSLNSEPGSSRKDHNQTDHRSPEHKSRRTKIKKIEEVKNDRKLEKKEEVKSDKSKLKKNEEPASDKSRKLKKKEEPGSDKSRKLKKNEEPGSDKSRKLKKNEEPGSDQSIKLKKNEELKSDKSKKLKENGEPKLDDTKLKKNEAAKLGKRKLKEPALAPDVETNDMETEGAASPAVLFVTFGPGSSLPTKNDLIKIYSKFGTLNKEETEMFYNNNCARVVFIRTSDAEKAYSSSQNLSPFGASSVSFRLRYPSAASKTRELREIESSSPKPGPQTNEGGKTPEKPSASQASAGELNYIREKLEMMTSMLENSDEKMSPEMKSKLENEMKDLWKKVSTMAGSSSS